MNAMSIYSIGYQRLTTDHLMLAVQTLGIDVVLDVRTSPHSRVKGFGGRQLATLLGERYEARGADLGGLGPGPTEAGISSLRSEARAVLLLCLEELPWHCHRHLTIASRLLPSVDVQHLVYVGDDLHVISASAVEELSAAEDRGETVDAVLDPIC